MVTAWLLRYPPHENANGLSQDYARTVKRACGIIRLALVQATIHAIDNALPLNALLSLQVEVQKLRDRISDDHMMIWSSNWDILFRVAIMQSPCSDLSFAESISLALKLSLGYDIGPSQSQQELWSKWESAAQALTRLIDYRRKWRDSNTLRVDADELEKAYLHAVDNNARARQWKPLKPDFFVHILPHSIPSPPFYTPTTSTAMPSSTTPLLEESEALPTIAVTNARSTSTTSQPTPAPQASSSTTPATQINSQSSTSNPRARSGEAQPSDVEAAPRDTNATSVRSRLSGLSVGSEQHTPAEVQVSEAGESSPAPQRSSMSSSSPQSATNSSAARTDNASSFSTSQPQLSIGPAATRSEGIFSLNASTHLANAQSQASSGLTTQPLCQDPLTAKRRSSVQLAKEAADESTTAILNAEPSISFCEPKSRSLFSFGNDQSPFPRKPGDFQGASTRQPSRAGAASNTVIMAQPSFKGLFGQPRSTGVAPGASFAVTFGHNQCSKTPATTPASSESTRVSFSTSSNRAPSTSDARSTSSVCDIGGNQSADKNNETTSTSLMSQTSSISLFRPTQSQSSPESSVSQPSSRPNIFSTQKMPGSARKRATSTVETTTVYEGTTLVPCSEYTEREGWSNVTSRFQNISSGFAYKNWSLEVFT